MSEMQQLKIQYVPIDSIHANSYNPNRQSTQQFDLLVESMRSEGFTQPIIVQEISKEIVDGYHRWEAAKILGHAKIPVVFVSLTMEQQLKATLQHNWARGNEDASLAALVTRELLKEVSIEELSDMLKISVFDIKLELTAQLPDVDIAELFPELAGGAKAIPVDASDRLHQAEDAAKKQLNGEESDMRAADNQYYFVSLTFTTDEGVVIEKALSSIDSDFNAAFVQLCQRALQNGW